MHRYSELYLPHLGVINTNGQKHKPICSQFVKAAIERTVQYETEMMIGSMKELSPEIVYATIFLIQKNELCSMDYSCTFCVWIFLRAKD